MEPVALMRPDEVESALNEMQSGAAPLIRASKKKGKLLRLSQRRRIFAKKVARKCHNLSDQLSNHPLATPIRVALLATGGWIIATWPQWVPTSIIVFAVAWVSWLLMRSWAGQSEIERQRKQFRKTGVHPAAVRQWLDQRPITDRFTEWLGSVLVGSLSCIVLSLFGLAVWQSLTAANVEGWAFYTWLAITCTAGCIFVVCCSRWWESELEPDLLQRRMVMLGGGLLTGLVSIAVANLFLVDLTFADFTRPDSNLIFGLPLPVIPAWIAFFVLLFGLLSFWKSADPLRPSRLKIWDVGVCLLMAAILSQLLGLPLINACILSGVISISIQLAAPWLGRTQRELVGISAKNSKVA